MHSGGETMRLSDLFVARIKTPSGSAPQPAGFGTAGPTGEQPAQQNGVGVFITPKSLTSFPIASLAVKIICTLGGQLVQNPSPVLLTKWIPLIASLFIGSIIFFVTINDADAKPKNQSGWFVAIAVGVLNALYLAGVSLKLF
jgi:hypothetical protein